MVREKKRIIEISHIFICFLGCNKDVYCDGCFAQFHSKGKKSKHKYEIFIPYSTTTISSSSNHHQLNQHQQQKEKEENDQEEEDEKLNDGPPPPLSLNPNNNKKKKKKKKKSQSTSSHPTSSPNQDELKQPQQEEEEEKGDWVEYWDEEAKSMYFYNSQTGEASWTKPPTQNN